MYVRSICFAIGIALGNSAIAQSDQAGSVMPLPPEIINQMVIINKLIALGELRKDPLLLIVAAKLQKTLSAEPVVNVSDVSTNSILGRAKKMAQGRKDIIELADDVLAMRSKDWTFDKTAGHLKFAF